MQQLRGRAMDAVVVAVRGGGLISGIGALQFMIDTEHQLIEGAAAAAIAAGLKAGRTSAGPAMVIVSCGANISSTVLAEAIASAPAR